VSAFGSGPLQGFEVRATGEPKENTLRGAFLQMLSYQDASDVAGEFKLLDHVPHGEKLAIAELFAREVLFRHQDLGYELGSTLHGRYEQATADGYVHFLPTVERDVESECRRLRSTPAQVGDGIGFLSYEWPTGERLEFIRHLELPLWKRYVEEPGADEPHRAPQPWTVLQPPAVEVIDEPEPVDEPPLEEPSQGAVEKLHALRRLAEARSSLEASGPRPISESVAELREQVLGDDEQGSAMNPTEGEPGEGVACPPELGSPEVDIEAQAKAIAEHTLDLAKAQVVTPWHQLRASEPTSPPEGAPCCSCATDVLDPALGCEVGGATIWAHPECVDAELELYERKQKEAAEFVPRDLELALAAESMKPFKARHKPYVCRACGKAYKEAQPGSRCECGSSVQVVHPACAICQGAIGVGARARKKSRTSSKRMHSACVERVLEQHKKQGAANG